jgi:glycosyltransferase involved in cell wall biosynthesis
MKIFVATNLLPKPDIAAGDRRLFAILQMLCEQHKVVLLIQNSSPQLKDDEHYIEQLKQIGIHIIVFGERYMRRTMLKHTFQLGIFEFFNVARELGRDFRFSQSGIPVIVDSVDIHYMREAGAVKLGKLSVKQAAITKECELRVYNEATGVIVLTKEDEEALRQDLPGIKTWLIPIIVPLLERRNVPRKPILLFIGGFKHHPNLDGILWFANEVLPLIHQKVPNAELLIVGSHPTKEVSALNNYDGIKVIGFVPDTIPYLNKAAVSIAPLRYGAGMKGKVSEALAAGIAVVTTSLGIQGFSAISGEHLLVADEAQQFANHVITLLNDPTEAFAMGARGRRLVKDICSADVVQAALNKMLGEATLASDPSQFKWKRIAFFIRCVQDSLNHLIRRILKRLWILRMP